MADNDEPLMSGALGSPKVHSATTSAARRLQSSAPAYLDDQVHDRFKRLAAQGTQLPLDRSGLHSARINPTAVAAEIHDSNEPDDDIIMDDYDADFPGLPPDVHPTQFEPGVPADHAAAAAAEALRRSKTIYNPQNPSQDDQADADADADGVALGVIPDHEGRRWRERRMRLARYIQFVDGPAIDGDDVPAPLAAYLDLEFERDGAVVLAPVVKGGRGKEGLGGFVGARPGPRGVELRKRREVVGDDGVDEVGAVDYYGGGRDVADLFYYELGAANAAIRPAYPFNPPQAH